MNVSISLIYINIYAVRNVITNVFPCKMRVLLYCPTVTLFYTGCFLFSRINILVFNFNVTRGQHSVIHMQIKEIPQK